MLDAGGVQQQIHGRRVALMPASDLLAAWLRRIGDAALLPAQQLKVIGSDDGIAKRALQAGLIGPQHLRETPVAEHEAVVLRDEDAGMDRIDERAVARLAWRAVLSSASIRAVTLRITPR